ncbi:Maf1-domain-containing protein [Microstroma glucosiphilum]|uniref:Maf1-domain-containing protein n=1 Tax=Pseudomicrostroma glucosiphilum TaxID=1684307 RepID=A0A316UCY0_9BASI|nr:Maf1-domain-containing protein [Pseudomicrostroma glucosiphilum]PWN22738.1 Maf1-domain-containing protein [Pseudomicrostroma glucosiphilum]
MKFLDYPELESLSRALTFESAECKVFTRLEAYSCKAVSKEKRLYKALEDAYHQAASTSPPDYLHETLASPFGRLDQPNARKTLFLLIALLNGAFPDHDFSQVNPSDFRKEPSPASVLHSLSSTLHSLRNNSSGPRSYSTFTGSFDDAMLDRPGHTSYSLPGASGPKDFSGKSMSAMTGATHAGLASLLDDIMDIRECDVYTFHPDMDSDPHACAEPDEEGMDFDDPSDGFWNEDADVSMQSVNVVTPRRGSAELDAPLFDEDLEGDSDGPHTPHMPHQTASGAAQAFPSSMTPRKDARSPRDGVGGGAGYVSSSLSSSSSLDMEDDDDVDGTGGLLWSTYAFFYNRRLKRMLFVSVWSRMNSSLTAGAGWTSPLTSYAPALPSSVTSTKTDRTSQAASAAPARKQTVPTPDPSPAKMAISRATSGRGGRRRMPSGSPAPSSLSPFPHASPRTPSSSGRSALGASRETTPARGQTPSAAAAAAAVAGRKGLAAFATGATREPTSAAAVASKRTADSDESGGKRTRRQVAT